MQLLIKYNLITTSRGYRQKKANQFYITTIKNWWGDTMKKYEQPVIDTVFFDNNSASMTVKSSNYNSTNIKVGSQTNVNQVDVGQLNS